MKFIDASLKVVDDCVNEVFLKISEQIEPTYSKELAQFAKEIFDSKGTVNGRSWQSNTPSTEKRKGKNHRNVNTGELEETLTTEGFLMNDDYMDELDDKYHFANDVGDGANRFDDIGQRETDQEIIAERTIKKIAENYR